MNLTRILIPISFAIGFVPVAILAVLYGWRTDWKRSDPDTREAGRGMLYLFSTTAVSYGLSVAVLVSPWLQGQVGEWIRIGVRTAIGLVLWNVLRIFLKAQKSGRQHAE